MGRRWGSLPPTPLIPKYVESRKPSWRDLCDPDYHCIGGAGERVSALGWRWLVLSWLSHSLPRVLRSLLFCGWGRIALPGPTLLFLRCPLAEVCKINLFRQRWQWPGVGVGVGVPS